MVSILTNMTEPAKKAEAALEADPVWDLVDQAPTQLASSHFARATVQLVREREQRQPWWRQFLAPMPIAGLTAATAAITLLINISLRDSPPGVSARNGIAQAEAIQEAVVSELLMAAAENPNEFSDQELVALLGF